MILPDANLLLYAVNADSREHAPAFQWWKELLDGETEVGLCAPVIFSFLRLGTNRRILSRPLSVDAAFAYVENWLEFRQVGWLEAEFSDLQTTKALLLEVGTGGNLVTDAQIAAIALRHDATVHTADFDFSRFAGVKWENPLLK